MNNELFLKRFKLFRTLAVGEMKGDLQRWCGPYGNICTVSSCGEIETLEPDRHPHLVLLFIDNDLKRAEECMERLKKLQVFPCGDFRNNAAILLMKLGLRRNNIFDDRKTLLLRFNKRKSRLIT